MELHPHIAKLALNYFSWNMLQDFRRVQHLNLEPDEDGLSRWPACTRHSENTAVRAVQQPRHKTPLCSHSQLLWASSGPGKQLLGAAGPSCTPALQAGDPPGRNVVETRIDPGTVLETGLWACRGWMGREMEHWTGFGIHTHMAQHYGLGNYKQCARKCSASIKRRFRLQFLMKVRKPRCAIFLNPTPFPPAPLPLPACRTLSYSLLWH